MGNIRKLKSLNTQRLFKIALCWWPWPLKHRATLMRRLINSGGTRTAQSALDWLCWCFFSRLLCCMWKSYVIPTISLIYKLHANRYDQSHRNEQSICCINSRLLKLSVDGKCGNPWVFYLRLWQPLISTQRSINFGEHCEIPADVLKEV